MNIFIERKKKDSTISNHIINHKYKQREKLKLMYGPPFLTSLDSLYAHLVEFKLRRKSKEIMS